MSEKIMMRASFEEPLFDASPWFLSGKYQRYRNRDKDLFPFLEYSQVIMMRTSPQPFSDEDLRHLRAGIYIALTDDPEADFPPAVPASVESIGVGSDFDPRPQLIYISSGFQCGYDAPGAPIDHYQFYTLLDGKRFYVSVARDGETGHILYTSRRLTLSIPKDEAERRFQELQSKADHQSWLDAPGWKKRSGEPCPWPGTWECPELRVGKPTFAHNMPFLRINGLDVTWRFVS